MRLYLIGLLAIVTSACVSPAAPPSAPAAHANAAAAANNTEAGRLTIRGPAGQQAVFTESDLAALPHHQVVADMHGARQEFSGVMLTDLLARVGAPSNAALRGADLRHVVIVTARDGYSVALSLAETDADFRASRVIVADRMNGAALSTSDGPFRLVVEGDLKPARSARMIDRIEVRKLD